MLVTGRCHCGAIEYTATIDPERVVVCHCSDCQSMSGTAFRVVAFTLEDALTVQRGEPRLYTKVAASGRERVQAFCDTCGSAIYATAPGPGPKVYGLRVGTLDQRAALIPRRQIWTGSALGWLEQLPGLPGSPGQ